MKTKTQEIIQNTKLQHVNRNCYTKIAKQVFESPDQFLGHVLFSIKIA